VDFLSSYVVSAESINCFKNRLDKFCKDQEIIYNFRAEIYGTGNRSEVLSSDLSFDRHVSIVSASSFYRLRQLQRSRRSLDTESAATLVHSFVASRIDYCNAVLAGAPKATANKLQRVLNTAGRVVSGTHKFDRGLTRLLHTELHWLDVPERVMYKLGGMVFNCLHGQAPQYLVELCQPVAGVASRHL